MLCLLGKCTPHLNYLKVWYLTTKLAYSKNKWQKKLRLKTHTNKNIINLTTLKEQAVNIISRVLVVHFYTRITSNNNLILVCSYLDSK